MGLKRRFSFSLNLKNFLYFVYLGLTIGFFLGTLTLMGPVRWVTNILRGLGIDQSYEDLAVKIIILLLGLITLLAALWLTRIIEQSTITFPGKAIPVLTGILALSSLFYWMNPSSAPISNAMEADISTRNGSFTFGPYPLEEDLARLKNEGYTDIIPLLHNAVVPFEPKLLNDEISSAEKIGINIIHVPMLPWVSDNEESLRKVKDLAENGTGKYYIHCYLGKDRVNVVRNIIEKYSTGSAGKKRTHRKLTQKKYFERGEIVQAEDSIFITPYPTDGEFTSYIFSGNVNTLVSILDPSNKENLPWIEKEEKLVDLYEMNYWHFPIPASATDEVINGFISEIRKKKKPVVIHAFLIPSKVTDRLIKAFNETDK